MVKLTEKQKAGLQALAEMSDDDIDFSDIPEMTDEGMGQSQKGHVLPTEMEGIHLPAR